MFKELVVIAFLVSICIALPMPCPPSVSCGPLIVPGFGTVGLGGAGGNFPGINGQNVPAYTDITEKLGPGGTHLSGPIATGGVGMSYGGYKG